MKIVIDRDLCEANGVCARVAPEAFLLDERDLLHLRLEQVPSELHARVEKAVQACPKGALSLAEK